METLWRKIFFYSGSLITGVVIAHLLNLIAVITVLFFHPSIPSTLLWIQFYAMGLAFFMSLHFTLLATYIFDIHKMDIIPTFSVNKLPRISVIIPAYNEESSIEKSITAVLSNGYPRNLLEIIVVDDGSTDNTTKIASRYPVRVISHKKNMGRGAAIHTGIKEANGDILVTIDADTIPEHGSIKRLVSTFINPDVGASCGFIIPEGVNGFLKREQRIEYLLGFAFTKPLRSRMGWMLIPSGAFSAYRKSVVFDATPTNTMAEDFDLGLHVHEKGYNVVYMPHARARTMVPTTLHRFVRQRIRWTLGGLQVMAKHRSIMMRSSKPSVSLFGLPYHYLMGYAVPPIEILGMIMLFLLPLTIQVSWEMVTWLGVWLLLIKLYSLPTLLIPRQYAEKLSGIKLPLWQIIEYWLIYYYILIFSTLSGIMTYMKKGTTQW